MKRLLMLSVLSLTAVFLVTSLAVGQTGATKSSTSSKVTPKRDKTKPYKFKTTGAVKFPSAFCAPNANNASCLPLRCPAGVRDARYCSRPTLAQVCAGTVKIVFKQGKRTRSTNTVILKPTTCKYSSSVTIRQRNRNMKVTVSFSGNTILAKSKASTKTARSG